MAEDLKLPTREDLEQLYREKGKEAVVWFAWRCALRASPVLGARPLETLWSNSPVRHIYSVIKVSFILSNFFKTDISTATATAYAYAYAARAATADVAADVAYVADAVVAAYAHSAYATIARADARVVAKLSIINDYQWALKQDKFKWQMIPLWEIKPVNGNLIF
jgi:hypothetical protein